MLEIVPDIAQNTHCIRNIFADIRNVPTGVPCVYHGRLESIVQDYI